MTLYAITPRDRTTAPANPVTLAMDVTAQVICSVFSFLVYVYCATTVLSQEVCQPELSLLTGSCY